MRRHLKIAATSLIVIGLLGCSGTYEVKPLPLYIYKFTFIMVTPYISMQFNPYDYVLKIQIFYFFILTAFAISPILLIIKSDLSKASTGNDDRKRELAKKTLYFHISTSSALFTFLTVSLLFSHRSVLVDLIYMYYIATFSSTSLLTFFTYYSLKRKTSIGNAENNTQAIIQNTKHYFLNNCIIFALLTALILLVGPQNPPPLEKMIMGTIWVAIFINACLEAYKHRTLTC